MRPRSKNLPIPLLPIVGFVLSLFLLLAIVTVWGASVQRDRVLVNNPVDYSITGTFEIDGTFPIKERYLKSVQSQHEEINLWGSWVGRDWHTGTLTSPEFSAPPVLRLFVAGYPKDPKNFLGIENLETGKTLRLAILQDPEKSWRKFTWILPRSWWGKAVRTVAVDRAISNSGWLGVSSPIKSHFTTLLTAQFKWLAIAPIYLVHFFLFIMPGLLLAISLNRYFKADARLILPLSLVASCLIGYFTFWIYFFNHYLGIISSVSLIIITFYFSKKYLSKSRGDSLKFISNREIYYPLILMAVVGLLYLSFLYVVEPINLSDLITRWRFFSYRPIDNVIPSAFANTLYSGDNPRNLIGDWLSSDRPPLQAGIILSQRPIMALTDLSYQVLSTIVQCSWIPAIWLICRVINLSGQKLAIIFSFTIFSGFFLFNSVYVWPKLIAAALVSFAFACLLQSVLEKRPLSNFEIGFSATSVALAMLAHGSAVFTLPAMLLLALLPKTLPEWRKVAVGLVILFCLLAPWSAYQKFYEPPGNRLVKMHLAGVHQIDDRSSGQTIFSAYREIGLGKALAYKWENTKKLFGSPSQHRSASMGTAESGRWAQWRIDENEHVFKTLGILNFGWIILLVRSLSNAWKSRRVRNSVAIVLGTGVMSLGFWVGILFGPGATTITHSSYAMLLLFFVGLSLLIAEMPRWFVWPLLCLQIGLFGLTWIGTTPPYPANTLRNAPNLPMVALAAISIVGAIWLLGRLFQETGMSAGE